MGLVARKPVFGVSDEVIFKPAFSDELEYQNFARSKFRYNTFQKANNKGAGQTAHTRRLVCAFVVCKTPKTGFLASRPTWFTYSSVYSYEPQNSIMKGLHCIVNFRVIFHKLFCCCIDINGPTHEIMIRILYAQKHVLT